jgi:anaphase-promoting complex subunit 8
MDFSGHNMSFATSTSSTMEDGATNTNTNTIRESNTTVGGHFPNHFDLDEHSTNVNNPNLSVLQQQQQQGLGSTPSGLWDVEEVRQSLRGASIELSKRGLKLAAKWAAEQLVGLPTSLSSSAATPSFWYTPPKDGIPPKVTTAVPWDDHHHQHQLEDHVIYAQSLFDMGEFDAAAYALSQQPSTTTESRSMVVGREDMGPPLPQLSPYGIFLRAYALYLSGERRKEQDLVEITKDPLERSAVTNTYLPQLQRELAPLYQQRRLDPFGIYVYGMVLKELATSSLPIAQTTTSSTGSTTTTNAPTVHAILLDSLRQYPYNWSAWLDLASVCINNPIVQEEVEATVTNTQFLAHHWMYYCFLIHLFLEQQQEEQALQLIHRLLFSSATSTTNSNAIGLDKSTSTHPKVNTTSTDTDEDDMTFNHENFNSNICTGLFVQSNFLKAMTAVAYYNLRDFDTAQDHFLELCQRDPFRLDQMDIFSNILYVKESKAELRYVRSVRNNYFLTW